MKNKSGKTTIEDLFEKDFFSAQTQCETDMGKIDQAEYDKMYTDYVVNWFESKEKNTEKIPDREQAAAIGSANRNIEVVARAGSGKTTTIIGRADFLINHCNVDPNSILMLAFNTKAAEEMRERMEGIVGKDARNNPHIKTFHALVYAVANREEDKKKPLIFDKNDSSEYDPKDKEKELSQLIQGIIQESIRTDPNSAAKFRKLMISYFRGVWETIEKGGYNLPEDDQLTLRRSLETRTLNDEEVGSLKEKIVADILFEHGIEYDRWIKNGVIKVPINKGRTLRFKCIEDDRSDAYYFEQYQTKNTVILGPREFNKGEDRVVEVIAEVMKQEKKTFKRLPEEEIWKRIQPRAIDEFTKAMTTFVGRSRKKDIVPEELERMVHRHRSILPVEDQFLELAMDIYREYVRTLEENNWEDFDGLIRRAIDYIEKGRVIFGEKGDFRRIKHIMIDEYQDFSLLFDMFITAIRKVCPDATMFCVGDDWQAINAFAGSDTYFFNRFERRYEDSRRYYITTNYRSVPQIVEIGNNVMRSWTSEHEIRPFRKDKGLVRICDLNSFNESGKEADFKADRETKATIRLIRWLLKNNKSVVLLFRTNAKLDDGYLDRIKGFFPAEDRKRITAFTTHKYKGKQEDAVIIMDAVERKYPLIHPTWIFMRIFDDEYRRKVLAGNALTVSGDVTLRKIEGDEKRLFYVALTRAKDCLFILTRKGEESRFLTSVVKKETPKITWKDYIIKDPDEKRITVEVKNNANIPTTYYIKDELKLSDYKYDGQRKCWYKSLPVSDLDGNPIADEEWVKKAKNVFVDIKDNEGNLIKEYVIESHGRFREVFKM